MFIIADTRFQVINSAISKFHSIRFFLAVTVPKRMSWFLSWWGFLWSDMTFEKTEPIRILSDLFGESSLSRDIHIGKEDSLNRLKFFNLSNARLYLWLSWDCILMAHMGLTILYKTNSEQLFILWSFPSLTPVPQINFWWLSKMVDD